MFRLFLSLTITLSLWLGLGQTALGASHTSPPAGALVVRYESPGSGEFTNISSALKSLPDDNSAQTIFIYPGIYTEQVRVTRPGPLTVRCLPSSQSIPTFWSFWGQFIGYTMDDTSYTSNSVSIQFGLSSAAAGCDDSSSTLSIHKDDFKMYNVNVTNTFPGSPGGSPAIALSENGNRAAFYTCAFIGFQDTVLANQGTQVYLNSYFEVIKSDRKRTRTWKLITNIWQGAVDFVFGQRGQAYFEGNTIAMKGPGSVTANGRSSNDNTSCEFVYLKPDLYLCKFILDFTI